MADSDRLSAATNFTAIESEKIFASSDVELDIKSTIGCI